MLAELTLTGDKTRLLRKIKSLVDSVFGDKTSMPAVDFGYELRAKVSKCDFSEFASFIDYLRISGLINIDEDRVYQKQA